MLAALPLLYLVRSRVRKATTLALLALPMTATPVGATPFPFHDGWDRDQTAHGGLVEVQVLVEGRSAPLYSLSGQYERRYFEASRDRHYALRIRNRSGRRVGVLIAVDGLNVVNGERSALSRGEPMYVLDPWERATIRGWRTSLEQVRQFVFVDEERSYASRTDQANGDMGWIRVLAFEEERPIVGFLSPEERRHRREKGGEDAPRSEQERRMVPGRSAAEAPKSKEALTDRVEGQASPEGAFPGTGWGERRHDPVRRTWFEPARHASDHIVLRYEYASGLHALGIFPDRDRLHERERGELGFARPPRR